MPPPQGAAGGASLPRCNLFRRTSTLFGRQAEEHPPTEGLRADLTAQQSTYGPRVTRIA